MTDTILQQLSFTDIPLDRHPVGIPTGIIGHGHDVNLNPVLVTCLGVVQQFGSHRAPILYRLANAIKLGP